MATGYVLYNNKAGDAASLESVNELKLQFNDELKFLDALKIDDIKALVKGLSADDYIIIAGGDGTLNHFANDVSGLDFKNDVLLYPCGTGNDFARDLGFEKKAKPFSVKKYLENLPTATINGKDYLFINGIGYGIDGYCCEVGDKQKANGIKKVNYTGIAIKGLLFHFKPVNAIITVDGKEYNYKKVWLAPTMNGRYYGGGMCAAPNQKRLSEDKKLSVMLFHGKGRLMTLMVFPSIFKGEHIKKTKMVKVLEGKEIKVEFNRPTALQVDGETILGVTSYTATTKTKVSV